MHKKGEALSFLNVIASYPEAGYGDQTAHSKLKIIQTFPLGK
jgi:hypothetical protein